MEDQSAHPPTHTEVPPSYPVNTIEGEGFLDTILENNDELERQSSIVINELNESVRDTEEIETNKTLSNRLQENEFRRQSLQSRTLPQIENHPINSLWQTLSSRRILPTLNKAKANYQKALTEITKSIKNLEKGDHIDPESFQKQERALRKEAETLMDSLLAQGSMEEFRQIEQTIRQLETQIQGYQQLLGGTN